MGPQKQHWGHKICWEMMLLSEKWAQKGGKTAWQSLNSANEKGVIYFTTVFIFKMEKIYF